jgi:hypothetical protein
MRIPPLGTVVALAIGVAAAVAAQCRMTYSISVYNDGAVSSDYSAVYGYSSSIDNSILCGCGHGGYQTTTTVYAPDGSSYPSTQGGMSSSVSVPVNGRMGTYQVIGRISLYCSCAGPVAAGGLAASLYACPFPAGEMSEAVSWFSGSDYIGATFMMDLKEAGNTNPPALRYQGRVVSERLSDLVDGCWFPGSDEPKLPLPDPSAWSSWTVTSINKYGGDQIANPASWVRYYQQVIATNPYRYENNECSETDTQTMLMNGCAGGPGCTYDIHQIKIVVQKDKVTVFRGNGQATGN